MSVNNVTGLLQQEYTTAAANVQAAGENLETLGLAENSASPTGDAFLSSTTGKKEVTQAEYDSAKSNYDAALNELNKLKDDLEAKEKELQREQDTYKELEGKYKKNENKYKAIEEEIDSVIKKEQNEQDEKNKKVYQILNDYDPNSGMDYKTYLSQAFAKVFSGSDYSGLINTLSNESSEVLKDLGSLKTSMTVSLTKISMLETECTNLKGEISTKQADVDAMKTSLDNMTVTVENPKTSAKASKASGGEVSEAGKQALASLKDTGMIGDSEMKIIEEAGIDLTEQLSDGTPRYIIAKGKKDDEYHVYERDTKKKKYASIVRQNAPGKGYDIIKKGNGYLTPSKGGLDFDPSKDYDSENIMYYDSNAEEVGAAGDYCTSSPLSLDINGDGVKTSDKVVDFDIDGDGIMDKINDSADAVLVFDKDGDGISGANGSETFGDNTDLDGDGKADGYKNGFEALKALAQKEGLVNGADDNKLDADDLKQLEEKYGLKIKTGGYNGEASSLADIGITEINLATTDETTLKKDFDGNQNDIMTQEGATFKINGEEREYADIWHSKKDDSGNTILNSTASSSYIQQKGSSLNFDTSVSEKYESIINSLNEGYDGLVEAKKSKDVLRGSIRSYINEQSEALISRLFTEMSRTSKAEADDAEAEEKADTNEEDKKLPEEDK